MVILAPEVHAFLLFFFWLLVLSLHSWIGCTHHPCFLISDFGGFGLQYDLIGIQDVHNGSMAQSSITMPLELHLELVSLQPTHVLVITQILAS